MSPANRRVTLRDIAKATGFHFTTVSLALRNHPRLLRSTCEQVQRAARELGYIPDPMLVSLARHRHGLKAIEYQATLAWITAFPQRDQWREIVIFNEQHTGAERRAQELGFRLEHFWLAEPGMSSARASQILSSRGIAGLIVAPLPQAHGSLALDWGRFSAVAIGYSLIEPALNVASAHQYSCIRLALHELKQRGYRRVGLVMLKASDDRVDSNWLAGYLTRRYESSGSPWPEPLLLPAWSEKSFLGWLHRGKADAIVTKMPQVLPALQSAGIAVPDSVGLAFLGEIPPNDIYSGVNENPRQVGAAAVDFVVGMMQRNERGPPALPQRLLIDGVWTEGSTVRPRPVAVSTD